MSLAKLSLAGKNLIIPGRGGRGLVSDIPAGDEKTAKIFYSVGSPKAQDILWFQKSRIVHQTTGSKYLTSSEALSARGF
jgi:hypothetical protein